MSCWEGNDFVCARINGNIINCSCFWAENKKYCIFFIMTKILKAKYYMHRCNMHINGSNVVQISKYICIIVWLTVHLLFEVRNGALYFIYSKHTQQIHWTLATVRLTTLNINLYASTLDMAVDDIEWINQYSFVCLINSVGILNLIEFS